MSARAGEVEDDHVVLNGAQGLPVDRPLNYGTHPSCRRTAHPSRVRPFTGSDRRAPHRPARRNGGNDGPESPDLRRMAFARRASSLPRSPRRPSPTGRRRRPARRGRRVRRTTGSALTMYERDGRRYSSARQQRVRGAHSQLHGQAHPRGDERRRIKRNHGDTASRPVRLRDRAWAASRSPAGARACRTRPRSTSRTWATATRAHRRPFDVGVIGVAVFATRGAGGHARSELPGRHARKVPTTPGGSGRCRVAPSRRKRRRRSGGHEAVAGAPVAPLAKLGTATAAPSRRRHGSQLRARDHRAAQLLAIQYDRYETSPRRRGAAASGPCRAQAPRPFRACASCRIHASGPRCGSWARALRPSGRARILDGPCPPGAPRRHEHED